MGDHRASIKIEFSIYGETYKHDSWINWSVGSSEVHEVDQRIIDFFRDSYIDARAKFDEENDVADEKRRIASAEAHERAEYERLKAKFG